MDRERSAKERPEKMGSETPYVIYVHCRVCWAVMLVGPMDLGRACGDCDPGEYDGKGDDDGTDN